ncbi:ABC transporter substrate-binding protein [Marinibaculum pumilum]|uniref:ABC transporter substrate-binding protein n=1 Tax=Marinibaculum pumilum TaxID=1766165 RepID=A0ABV7KZE1_9PROT
MKRRLALLAASAAFAFGIQAAAAQPAEDKLRLAFEFPISTVDWYQDAKPEIEMVAEAVFDSLISYNEETNAYEPLLAKSWERVDPVTLRFALRDDVKWHDGEAFDADDVVYTINWLIDPETKIRFKANWKWIKEVRKIDDHTVEIVAKQPTPHDMMRLAYGTQMLPEHVHGKLQDKMAFRDNVVGTGMYKVAGIDTNAGIELVKNPDYNHGGPAKPASNVGTFHIKSIPDAGARTAALLAGDVDLLRNTSYEEAVALSADPRFDMDVLQSVSYMYLALDALGKSGNDALKDERVRRAIMEAVDRNALQRARTGGEPEKRSPQALCWDFQAGCAYSEPLPPFDPAHAKKLLAEAGYGDGFDVVVHTFGSTRDYGEIVAGFLNQVGIRASVQPMTFATFRKLQAEGQLGVFVGAWNAGVGPDVGTTMGLFFSGDTKDYYHDPKLIELAEKAQVTTDPAAREAIVRELLDTAVQKSYIIPLSGIPIPVVHRSEIEIAGGRNMPYAFSLGDLNWKQ